MAEPQLQPSSYHDCGVTFGFLQLPGALYTTGFLTVGPEADVSHENVSSGRSIFQEFVRLGQADLCNIGDQHSTGVGGAGVQGPRTQWWRKRGQNAFVAVKAGDWK